MLFPHWSLPICSLFQVLMELSISRFWLKFLWPPQSLTPSVSWVPTHRCQICSRSPMPSTHYSVSTLLPYQPLPPFRSSWHNIPKADTVSRSSNWHHLPQPQPQKRNLKSSLNWVEHQYIRLKHILGTIFNPTGRLQRDVCQELITIVEFISGLDLQQKLNTKWHAATAGNVEETCTITNEGPFLICHQNHHVLNGECPIWSNMHTLALVAKYIKPLETFDFFYALFHFHSTSKDR